MHSINTSVSFQSRLISGLLLPGDNSKKLSRNYMDYLVECFSFYVFLKMSRVCRIRWFFFYLAWVDIVFEQLLWFVCSYCKYTEYMGEVTYSFLFVLLTNKPKPIEMGVQNAFPDIPTIFGHAFYAFYLFLSCLFEKCKHSVYNFSH